MRYIEDTAAKFARSIRAHHAEAASEAILTYALIIILNTAAIVSIAIVFSLFTGMTISTVAAIGIFAFLKFFTGGIHLKSSAACTIASSAMLILLVHAPYHYRYGGVWLTLLAIVLFYVYAPSGNVRKGTLPEKYIPYLKWVAIALCLLNLYWQNSLLTLIVTLQASTLTPPAFRFVDYLERRSTQ